MHLLTINESVPLRSLFYRLDHLRKSERSDVARMIAEFQKIMSICCRDAPMQQDKNTDKLANDEPLTRELRDAVLAKAIQAVDFRPTLTPETDRGCALMAAAYLDSQLEELLRAVFVDDQKVVSELLQSERALGSFSAKIDMAYSLGLLPADAYRDLHLIRKIRNECAYALMVRRRRISFLARGLPRA